MSRLFGPLRQMGYVVLDVEAAMKHWVEVCGVGPWFYAERLPLTAFTYAGKRYDDIHVSIGLANSGDMQIELIQQRSDHPSMYRDFLAAQPARRPAALVELAGELRRTLRPSARQRLCGRPGRRRAARALRLFPQ